MIMISFDGDLFSCIFVIVSVIYVSDLHMYPSLDLLLSYWNVLPIMPV